ncbi:hypothetical protein Tco_1427033 [Tanacetum coccineum]
MSVSVQLREYVDDAKDYNKLLLGWMWGIWVGMLTETVVYGTQGPPLDYTFLGVTERMPLLRCSFCHEERLKTLPKGGAPQYEDLCKKVKKGGMPLRPRDGFSMSAPYTNDTGDWRFQNRCAKQIKDMFAFSDVIVFDNHLYCC